MSDQVTFKSISEVFDHFDKSAKSAESSVALYRSQVLEFTGHSPDKPVTALDVVKIVQKVFFDAKSNTPVG